MSEAAVDIGASQPMMAETTTQQAPRASFASFVREHRAWRNAAIGVVAAFGILNLALLVVTAGF